MERDADIVIVGAGAAGLMAAIWAGRTTPARRIVALDSARTLGAKILVAGGGRCNVTHEIVTQRDFAGSTPAAIGKVLRRFDVPRTISFFREIGVELKREETGKLFPVTNRARTVLDALLGAAEAAGVTIAHPRQVTELRREAAGFHVGGPWGAVHAERLILATGGKSLPKSGSDGGGFDLARALGHTVTRLLPALVPLTLPRNHFLCSLSGVAAPATLDLWSESRRRLHQVTGSVLCTHFGISGPAVLDISRFYLDASAVDPGVTLTANWLPQQGAQELDRDLQQLGGTDTPLTHLRQQLPERLARGLIAAANAPGPQLTRAQRKAVVATVTACPLPISGHRGYNYAEATAGGVPLNELQLSTMRSRVVPDLFMCGEICDVDGRIGGFNFQWAWASGFVAGSAAAI